MATQRGLQWLLAGLMGLPLMASAAGLDPAALRQAQTAAAHAGMALGAPTLAKVHMHLHHVLNCLVGPGGAGFDAKELDPCKGMGHGAIRDAARDPGAQASLRKAAAEAMRGERAHGLAAAHADAKQVLATLQQVVGSP